MAAIVGTIRREPDLLNVGTFRADEKAITLDISDPNVLAKLKREMKKEWLVPIKPDVKEGILQDRIRVERPKNRDTLKSFLLMLEESGFVYTDVGEVEE